jgi:hypothetical protein
MKYRMEDGTIVDTDRATETWTEATTWDGRNHISTATGTQWNHKKLHQSRKGRFYVLHSSQMQGTRDHIEYVANEEAARWILANGHELPECLAHLEAEIVE